MPHPLPEDVNAVSGLRYYLVALPDDDAYSRAALAIYAELEKSWNWGLEGEINPESDTAGQQWAGAIQETIRLIQMGFPDTLLSHIDELEAMLRAIQNLSGCCPEEDVSDGDLYTDEVDDGVGSVPQNIIDAGYAADGNDWSSFETYKCMIAHVTIDDMEQKLRKLAPLVDDVGTVFGGIGALAAIMVALIGSGGTVMAIGIIGGLGAAAALWSKLTSGSLVTSIADGVAEHHQDLVCGFIGGDGTTGSISGLHAAIDEHFNIAESSILKNLNTGPIVKALYAGRYDQQNIAQILDDNGYVPSSFDCSCDGYVFEGVVGIKATLEVVSGTFSDTVIYHLGGSAYVFSGTDAIDSHFNINPSKTFAKGSASILDCGVYNYEEGGFNLPGQRTNNQLGFRVRNQSGSNHPSTTKITIDLASDSVGNNCQSVTGLNVISSGSGVTVSGNEITIVHPGNPNSNQDIYFEVKISTEGL